MGTLHSNILIFAWRYPPEIIQLIKQIDTLKFKTYVVSLGELCIYHDDKIELMRIKKTFRIKVMLQILYYVNKIPNSGVRKFVSRLQIHPFLLDPTSIELIRNATCFVTFDDRTLPHVWLLAKKVDSVDAIRGVSALFSWIRNIDVEPGS